MYKRVLNICLSTLLLGGCLFSVFVIAATSNIDADAVVSKTAVKGAFSSIQAAIDAAPDSGGWTIRIMAGTYVEPVKLNKPNMTFIGDGHHASRIQFNRYAGQRISEDTDETWGTFRTATVEVNADGSLWKELSIENTFDFMSNDALPDDHPQKMKGTQAVALLVSANVDRTKLESVHLFGYQDTLMVDGKRFWMHAGRIEGNVDYIFGSGNALFENVTLVTRARARAEGTTGFITAPSTPLAQFYGFTFLACRLLRGPGVPDRSVYLGRPWHPTKTFSDGRYADPLAIGKAVFINTFMDAHIATNGWTSMTGSTKEGGRKTFLPLIDARFAEYRSSGVGAIKNSERPQLPPHDIPQYTRQQILGTWQ